MLRFKVPDLTKRNVHSGGIFYEVLVDANVYDLMIGDVIELYDGIRTQQCRIEHKGGYTATINTAIDRATNIISPISTREEDYKFYKRFYVAERKMYINNDMIGINHICLFQLRHI